MQLCKEYCGRRCEGGEGLEENGSDRHSFSTAGLRGSIAASRPTLYCAPTVERRGGDGSVNPSLDRNSYSTMMRGEHTELQLRQANEKLPCHPRGNSSHQHISRSYDRQGWRLSCSVVRESKGLAHTLLQRPAEIVAS